MGLFDGVQWGAKAPFNKGDAATAALLMPALLSATALREGFEFFDRYFLASYLIPLAVLLAAYFVISRHVNSRPSESQEVWAYFWLAVQVSFAIVVVAIQCIVANASVVEFLIIAAIVAGVMTALGRWRIRSAVVSSRPIVSRPQTPDSLRSAHH